MFTINISETVSRIEIQSRMFVCSDSSIGKYDTDDLTNIYLKINYEAWANTEILVHSNYSTMHEKDRAFPVHTRKAYRRKEVWLHLLLTLPLYSGEWSTSCPSCFTSWERTPIPTEQQNRWAPEQGWTFWRKKSLAPTRIPGHSADSPVDIPTTLPWLTTNYICGLILECTYFNSHNEVTEKCK